MTQELGRDQVQTAITQELRKFLLHLSEPYQSWHMIGVKLHDNVYVAVRPKVIPQHRPEEGQLADMVTTAEIS